MHSRFTDRKLKARESQSAVNTLCKWISIQAYASYFLHLNIYFGTRRIRQSSQHNATITAVSINETALPTAQCSCQFLAVISYYSLIVTHC